MCIFFFFNDPATTEIYTLSLHDALPILAAGFAAGSGDGHHLINRTEVDALYLEVGARDEANDDVDYPDIDLIRRKKDGRRVFLHKDGTPY